MCASACRYFAVGLFVVAAFVVSAAQSPVLSQINLNNCNPQQLQNNPAARDRCAALLASLIRREGELKREIDRVMHSHEQELIEKWHDYVVDIGDFPDILSQAQINYLKQAFERKGQEKLLEIRTDIRVLKTSLYPTNQHINPTFTTPGEKSDGWSTSAAIDVNVGRLLGFGPGQRLTVSPYIGQSDTHHKMAGNAAMAALGFDQSGTRDGTALFGGVAAAYSLGPYFIRGAYGRSSAEEDFTNFALGSTGSYGTSDTVVTVKAGRHFLLGHNIGLLPGQWNAAMLSVAATGGRVTGKSDAFSDSAGRVFGEQETNYRTHGVEVGLKALIYAGGLFWQPHVGVWVERATGYENVFHIPAQGAFVGADVRTDGIRDSVGFDGGLTVATSQGWKLAASGFYQKMFDHGESKGGSLRLSLPLGN